MTAFSFRRWNSVAALLGASLGGGDAMVSSKRRDDDADAGEVSLCFPDARWAPEEEVGWVALAFVGVPSLILSDVVVVG